MPSDGELATKLNISESDVARYGVMSSASNVLTFEELLINNELSSMEKVSENEALYPDNALGKRVQGKACGVYRRA